MATTKAAKASKTKARHSSRLTDKLHLQPSPLSVAFRHIRPSWRHYIDYAKTAAKEGDPDMQKVVATLGGLSLREQATIMPEQLCELAGIQTEVLFGSVCTQLWRSSRMEANVITAINYPKVIERTAKSALTKTGVKDREMFHRATGFIKTPNGPSVVVNNNPQTAIMNGDSGGQMRRVILPSMEEEALELEDSISLPALPAPVESTPSSGSV